jgi:gamma-glutamyltranspeptidase/glutathione hydrolase
MLFRLIFLCAMCLGVGACTAVQPTFRSANVQPSPKQSSTVQPRFQNGAVAADSPIASDAGIEILKRGGNAVDAAVATGFTLAVVRPFSCGLGGGGFMVIHDPAAQNGEGESWALDYREVAPDAIGPMFFENQPATASGYAPSRFGGRATGVPGEIPGLLAAHARFGSLDLATVLAPATRAAYKGFAIDASYVSAIKRVASIRAKHPDLRPMSRWLWTHLCGSGTLSEGDVIRQPELAEFLARLSEEGIDAWRGESAESAAPLVAGTNRAYDGQLTAEDIRTYEPRWRKPLIAKNVFQDYDAVLMPPPSSGGVVLLQVLSMLDARLSDMGRPSMDSPEFTHLLAEALKHGFADRARYLADPDFAPVPLDQLCDRTALRALAETIDLTQTKPSDAYGLVAPPPDDRGTSHYSVIDRNGMTVAATETINATFGSLVVVPELGIVLNNELDDFTTIRGEANLFGLRQSDWNRPQPGKRPLSSMSPTILLREGRVAVTAGASGGPRIITGTLQVLLRILYEGDAPVDAVNAPRVHHQWLPDQLLLENGALSMQPSLEAFGHTIKHTGGVGVVQAIRATPNGLEPASDPRKGGRASGY